MKYELRYVVVKTTKHDGWGEVLDCETFDEALLKAQDMWDSLCESDKAINVIRLYYVLCCEKESFGKMELSPVFWDDLKEDEELSPKSVKDIGNSNLCMDMANALMTWK